MNKLIAGLVCACLVVGCIHGHNNNNNNEEILPEKSDKIGAVVVGMEISKLVGNCPGSYRDCQNIKDAVSLFTDNVTLLANEDATKDAVAKALQDAIDKYEFVYFYYSGHGGSQKFNTTGPEEIDGQDEYLCFYDDYMLDNEVWNIISKAKGPVFLMFDCCHSETMFRTPQFSFKNSLKRMQSSRHTDKKFAMLCWSGCPDNAYSYGSSSGGKLTNTFCEYFTLTSTYKDLWEKISTDGWLLKSQEPRQTIIGDWDVDARIFR